MSWKLRGDKAHSFLAGLIRKRFLEPVLKYGRNVREVIVRNKRGLFPEGSLPLGSGSIPLQLKPWKISRPRRESAHLQCLGISCLDFPSLQ